MRKPKPWSLGEAAEFVGDIGPPLAILSSAAAKPGPWDQPCGEALVDWPAFSKWLLRK